jgi:hypothetical protein
MCRAAPVIVMLGALCVGSSSALAQTRAASRRGDICNMRAALTVTKDAFGSICAAERRHSLSQPGFGG